MLRRLCILFYTFFFTLVLSSCIGPTHVTERNNHNPTRISEQTQFSRMTQLEIDRDVNRARLTQLLDQVFKEKEPDRRLQLIAPWLPENQNRTLSRHAQPHIWSILNLVSADAHRKLYPIDRKSNNLHKAIEYYQKAQQVITREKYPYEWAAIQNNLAKTYIDLSDRERIGNLEKVIELTQQASQIRTRQESPFDWASTQIIMAKAYRERIVGDKTSNLRKAVDLFTQALHIQTRNGYPEDFAITVYELSQALIDLGEYSTALTSITNALKVNDNQFKNENILPEEAQFLANQAEKLFANAIWIAIQLEDYSQAVSLTEWSKSRLLTKNLKLDMLAKDQEGSTQATTSPHIEEIYQWLSALPPDSTLVAPVFSDYGTVIFILPAKTRKIEKHNILSLPGFTRKDLHALMRGNTIGEWGGYIKTYMSWVVDQNDTHKLKSWQSELGITLDRILHSWLEPVLTRLQQTEFNNTTRLFWILDSDTNLLPIHSVTFRNQSLFEKYNMQFVPSLFSAFSAQKRLVNISNDRILAVINPTKDLKYASIEGELIGHFFESKTELVELDASLFNFNQGLKDKPAYLHMATHGSYNWKNPLESGLMLANGKFTLGHLFKMPNILNNNRLVFLSACETGIVDFNVPTESVGLPSAFLQAGAPGVISTLWSVPDKSTMLLTAKFYQLHREHHIEPSRALTQAQLWLQSATNGEIHQWLKAHLRNHQKSNGILSKRFERYLETLEKQAKERAGDKPYQSRFYWAGFVYTGI